MLSYSTDIINLPSWLVVSVFCGLLLLFVFVTSLIHKDYQNKEGRFFLILSGATIINLVFNCLSTVPPDGTAGNLVWLKIANFLNYTLTVLLFLIYAYFVLSLTRGSSKRCNLILLIASWVLFLADAGMCFASIFTPTYFSYESGEYARGPYFYVHIIFLFSIAILLEILMVSNRKAINKNLFRYLLFFPLMPFLGMVLQIIFYGIPFGLTFVTLSILFLFYFQSSQSLDVDHLTNTFNRRKFDADIQRKIKRGRAFSVILADYDNFKLVNDQYGHGTGDLALQEAAMVLKKALSSQDDYVARYGGDEFCLVTEVTEVEALKKIEGKIRQSCRLHNADEASTYRLNFSLGIASYDPKSGQKAHQFLALLDERMYEDKKNKGRR